MNSKPHTLEALHAETARISWSGLERHFARGVVIQVAEALDLVEVAVSFANDDKPAVERWLTSGELQRLSVETAKAWSADEHQLWAVVVAPWVLVQARVAGD